MMKTSFRIILALVILGFSTQSNAQYIALKGGVNLANMTNKDMNQTYSTNYTNRAGFHAGVVGGMRVGFIGVEGGLLISTKGYNFEYAEESGSDSYKYSGNTNLVYLDFPVNLVLSAGLGGTRVFATVGPIFGFGLTGKTTEEIIKNDEAPDTKIENIKWGNSANDNLLTTDVGLGFGGGIEIGTMTFSGTYNFGLTNIAANTANDAEIKNQVIQFSLAFKIFNP